MLDLVGNPEDRFSLDRSNMRISSWNDRKSMLVVCMLGHFYLLNHDIYEAESSKVRGEKAAIFRPKKMDVCFRFPDLP